MNAEIYTKTVCPHCVRAKGVLNQRGITVVEIDAPSNMEVMVDRVRKEIGRPPLTVPQIFIDGKYIGGADDLEEFFNKQDLAADLGGFSL